MIIVQTFLPNGTINEHVPESFSKNCLTISEDGNMLIFDYEVRGQQ
jgi:hypothetical protein